VVKLCFPLTVTDHLRSTIKGLACFFVLPFLITFIGAWSDGTGFFLFLFGIPAALLILVIFSVVSVVRGFKLGATIASARHKVFALLAVPMCLVTLYFMAGPLLLAGTYVGAASRLAVNQPRYSDIIEKARSEGVRSSYSELYGITYSVDLGPPVRVAFNPAGMLNNWSGIIFDPTGGVMHAEGFDPKTGKFVAPDRITKIFGGDLVKCWPLWSHYYRCSFT
jgi:hypothetical protein